MINACYVVLALGATCFTYRLVRGPSLADRVAGLDGLVIVFMAALTLRAVQTQSGAFLPVVVVIALVSFVSTAVVARFIEARSA